MDMMKAIRENSLYKQTTQGLSEDEIAIVERELETLTAPLRELVDHIRSLAADDKGFSQLIDSLDEIATLEEIERWQEKN